ncbi:YtfJ family protein [Thermodesulfobacteriota bacterium]
MKRGWLCILTLFFMFQGTAWAGMELGQIPPSVELKDKLGGHLDGSPWSSDELRGKVHVLFYADPDEKDLNNEASEALKEAKLPRDKYQSLAIINMAATWLPNFAISSSLKEKQKQYPTTIYLRDFKKVLVREWEIADNNNNVLAFDKKGRLIFRKDGKLEREDIETLLQAVRDHLDQ